MPEWVTGCRGSPHAPREQHRWHWPGHGPWAREGVRGASSGADSPEWMEEPTWQTLRDPQGPGPGQGAGVAERSGALGATGSIKALGLCATLFTQRPTGQKQRPGVGLPPRWVRAHQETQGQAVSAQPHSAAAGTLHRPRIQQAFNRWCLTFKQAFNSSSSKSSVDAHGVLTGAPWLHPPTPLGLFCLLCMDPWAAMVSPTQLCAL